MLVAAENRSSGRSNSRPRTECFDTNLRQLAGRPALLTCGTPILHGPAWTVGLLNVSGGLLAEVA